MEVRREREIVMRVSIERGREGDRDEGNHREGDRDEGE